MVKSERTKQNETKRKESAQNYTLTTNKQSSQEGVKNYVYVIYLAEAEEEDQPEQKI